MDDDLLELVARLKAAHKIAVLTGAGISSESGVPTFRDAQTGLWAHFAPDQLATPEAFARSPKLVWDWYAWRRKRVARAQPNPGHHALVKLSSRYDRFTLISQNVDGLHQLAGSRDVIELHGNISRIRCSRGCGVITDYAHDETPPRCPKCRAYLRPDVVWFGETLPAQALHGAVEAARQCDVFLCVGTSALVQPAASLPITALDSGATVIEVNTEATPISTRASYVLQGHAGAVLPALLDALDA